MPSPLLVLSLTPFNRVASIVICNRCCGQLPDGQVLHEGVAELVMVLLVPID